MFCLKGHWLLRLKVAFFLLGSALSVVPGFCQEPGFQKGICYASWEKDSYSSGYSDASLRALAETGAQWVEIVVTQYQKAYNSKRIFPTEKTASDASLAHAIAFSHSLGLKVMLKPHIDLIDTSAGLCRSDIGFQNPDDWQEWFSQYLKFILRYARLAQKSNVELFCIGTELSFASQKTPFWQGSIIPEIKKIYRGRLIYAANWDEYRTIKFWSGLDYAGIDAYFPLTERGNPGYEELLANWQRWANEIEAWQKEVGKPVVFTEIGYRSCDSCAARPWEVTGNGLTNVKIQSDCYQAALNTLCNRRWCRGLYWWYWKPTPFAGGLNNRDFTPQNKPAQIILSCYYKGEALSRFQ